jgi:hypothetical protein
MAQAGNTATIVAPVQRWNAQSVYVRCPYCTKIHTHGFGDSYKSVNRASHCYTSPDLSFPSYSFAYPFPIRDGTTTYEIDKSAGVFIALGSDALAMETTTIEGALDGLNLNDTRLTDQRSFKTYLNARINRFGERRNVMMD